MVLLTEDATVSIGETLTSSLSTVASDALSAIGTIMPVALTVMGAIVVINVGIRIFKKVTGK